MVQPITIVEVVTLFGFAREGEQTPERLFRTAEKRDAELVRSNSFTFDFAARMDINVRFRKPIDVTAARTEDGRYYHLVELPKELLTE